MISIGLSGAPGSGKTELALRLQKELDDDFEIVDGYADQIQKRYNLAIGTQATYFINEILYFARWLPTYSLVLADKNFIACGTDLDSLAYNVHQVESISKEIQTPISQEFMNRAQLVLQLSVLHYIDQGHPKLNYILPQKKEIILPDSSSESSVNDIISSKIRQLNLDMRLGFPILTGTLDENVEKIVKDVEGLKEHDSNVERQGDSGTRV